jgi:ParB-like chromosome segregation protein Spo0J
MEVTSISLTGLEPHPLAKIFPKFKKTELQTLSLDIQKNGLREPITIFEGKILDGVNRAAGAQLAGWAEIPCVKFEGDYEAARNFVISLNLNRRHLTDDQRAAIAAKLANMPPGRRSKQPRQLAELISVAEAADKLRVPARTVERAKAVERADPVLLDKVAEGETKLAAATKQVEEKKHAARNTATRQTKSKGGQSKPSNGGAGLGSLPAKAGRVPYRQSREGFPPEGKPEKEAGGGGLIEAPKKDASKKLAEWIVERAETPNLPHIVELVEALGNSGLRDVAKLLSDNPQSLITNHPIADVMEFYCRQYSLKHVVKTLIELYGFDAVSDAVLEHNP